jgi:hypothetical protein
MHDLYQEAGTKLHAIALTQRHEEAKMTPANQMSHICQKKQVCPKLGCGKLQYQFLVAWVKSPNQDASHLT